MIDTEQIDLDFKAELRSRREFPGYIDLETDIIKAIGIELAVLFTVIDEKSNIDEHYGGEANEKYSWINVPVIDIINCLNITPDEFHCYIKKLKELQIINFTYDAESLKCWYQIDKNNEKTLINLKNNVKTKNLEINKRLVIEEMRDEEIRSEKECIWKHKDKYNALTLRLTKDNYKAYINIINPDNLERSQNKYHLDHIYSVSDGFDNKIDPKIISNPYNLQMLSARKNRIKRNSSWQTEKELYKGYAKFENGSI